MLERAQSVEEYGRIGKFFYLSLGEKHYFTYEDERHAFFIGIANGAKPVIENLHWILRAWVISLHIPLEQLADIYRTRFRKPITLIDVRNRRVARVSTLGIWIWEEKIEIDFGEMTDRYLIQLSKFVQPPVTPKIKMALNAKLKCADKTCTPKRVFVSENKTMFCVGDKHVCIMDRFGSLATLDVYTVEEKGPIFLAGGCELRKLGNVYLNDADMYILYKLLSNS